MAMAVRRRAVCVLALLALLCGCCASFVCEATEVKSPVARAPAVVATQTGKPPPEVPRGEWEQVNVSVEVSCADKANKLSWRFPRETTWEKCAGEVGGLDYTLVEEEEDVAVEVVTVDVSQYGTGDDGVSVSLCASAESMYAAANCNVSCGSDKDGQAAFTMNFPTHVGSGVHKKWTEANASPSSSSPAAAAAGGALGEPGVCPLEIPAKSPAGGGASQGKAGSDAGERPPTLPAAPPAGPSGSGERGSGKTGTSPTPQRPPATPKSAAATTTTTIGPSPTSGGHGKSSADGSDAIATVWVRAPLLLMLLLLPAAVACHAGQR